MRRALTTIVPQSSALIALAGLLTVLGCEVPQGPPGVGDPAPAITAVALGDGASVSLEDYEGDVVLVNLWATWCAPCRFETPYLQSIYQENADRGLRIVGISVDSNSSLPAVKRFLEEMAVTYDILLDPDMISTNVFGAIGLPASFLLDRNGIIRFFQYGPILEGDPVFLKALDDVLSEEVLT